MSPVLIVVCERDNLVSPRSHEALVDILGDLVTVLKLDAEHWDVYKGITFEKNIEMQLDFLNKIINK